MSRSDFSRDADPAVRVLHLLLWITPVGGGIQSYLRGLLRAFEGAADVRFFGAAVSPGEQPGGFAAPVHLGLGTNSPWRNALRFARHVLTAARGADLVQIHGIYGPQFMFGAPLCWLLRVPYIVCPHNALAPWMLAHKAWKKRLFFDTIGGFFLRKAACILGTSPLEARDLEQRFPRARIRLVLAGISVPAEPDVELLKEGPTTELRLLYLGSFDPWKRVPSLVRAVAALRSDGVDARLVIAGTGPAHLVKPIDDAIATVQSCGGITRAGFVAGQQKIELITRSHALVLPAATDSYSIATAEALAHGLPVIITEGAGAAADVRSHGCGSVVPVDDERALATALRDYLDPALRRERALNAHRYALGVLGLPHLRAGLKALYDEMARPV